MDNNNNNEYTRRPRKRVTKQMARRRQLAALGIIVLILILIIVLICNACSDNKDKPKGENKTGTTTTTTAVTTVPMTTTVTTTATTVAVTTADPNDPNTITGITLDKYSVNLEVGGSDMPWVTMTPESSTEKGEIWESSDTSIATVDNIGNITAVAPGTCYVTVKSQNNPVVYAEVKVTVISANGTPANAAGQSAATTAANPVSSSSNETTATQLSNNKVTTSDGLSYVDGILIANKSYGLPESYSPGLDSTAESQFNALSEDAAKEGLNIWLASGYRSYDYQKNIYDNYVSIYGADTADTFSARPGYSEHQTGLAIDVNTIDDSFANTPESDWLAANCSKYGFIIRYPKGKESVTGYKYEPWHIRYVGKEKAEAITKSGLTLEEYYGIDSKYQ